MIGELMIEGKLILDKMTLGKMIELIGEVIMLIKDSIKLIKDLIKAIKDSIHGELIHHNNYLDNKEFQHQINNMIIIFHNILIEFKILYIIHGKNDLI